MVVPPASNSPVRLPQCVATIRKRAGEDSLRSLMTRPGRTSAPRRPDASNHLPNGLVGELGAAPAALDQNSRLSPIAPSIPQLRQISSWVIMARTSLVAKSVTLAV